MARFLGRWILCILNYKEYQSVVLIFFDCSVFIVKSKNLFHFLKFGFHLLLTFEKLLYKLILSINLFFEHIYYEVFRGKHVL